jgi:hypothetical protein
MAEKAERNPLLDDIGFHRAARLRHRAHLLLIRARAVELNNVALAEDMVAEATRLFRRARRERGIPENGLDHAQREGGR